jgi:hypothetical protein
MPGNASVGLDLPAIRLLRPGSHTKRENQCDSKQSNHMGDFRESYKEKKVSAFLCKQGFILCQKSCILTTAKNNP